MSFNDSCAKVVETGADPPQPVSIVLENANSTTYVVQSVMEYAADTGSAYKFTVTYCDKDDGYVIDVLNGLETAEDCQWYLFYRAPGAAEVEYQYGAKISYFVVAPNSTVVLSYEPEPAILPEPSPTPTPTPTPAPDNNRGAPPYGLVDCLAIVFSVLVGLASF